MRSLLSNDPWLGTMRIEVERYLKTQSLLHGQIGKSPAWRFEKIVSIWAIESRNNPGWVGWWAISGDLPTDYISAEKIKHPRAALRALCLRWKEKSEKMIHGQPCDSLTLDVDQDWPTLGSILKTRVELLEKMAASGTFWDYDESEFESIG